MGLLGRCRDGLEGEVELEVCMDGLVDGLHMMIDDTNDGTTLPSLPACHTGCVRIHELEPLEDCVRSDSFDMIRIHAIRIFEKS